VTEFLEKHIDKMQKKSSTIKKEHKMKKFKIKQEEQRQTNFVEQ